MTAEQQKIENERFEAWYVTTAFDYPREPIGSRDCCLMRKAWLARADLVTAKAGETASATEET